MLTFLISWWWLFLLASLALGFLTFKSTYKDVVWMIENMGNLDNKENLKTYIKRNAVSGLIGLFATASFVCGFIGAVGAIAKL